MNRKFLLLTSAGAFASLAAIPAAMAEVAVAQGGVIEEVVVTARS